MENIPLPQKVTYAPDAENANRALVTIEPCYPGYGTTLGNALRRVLLSSLAGGAITSVKIKGVDHEFSSIENVLEDVVEISLNLKQVCLLIHTDEPVKLTLKASGETIATAGNIEKNAEVEVANPDLHIATLTSKDADLEMEITVEKGRGYVPVEARDKDDLEVGMIALDALFTPVLNVGMHIEKTRVGQRVDYDKVILDIETDGSITPQEAMQRSASILIDHFAFIQEGNETTDTERIAQEEVQQLQELKAIPGTDEAIAQEAKAEEEKEEEVKEEVEVPKKKRGRPRKTKEEEVKEEVVVKEETE